MSNETLIFREFLSNGRVRAVYAWLTGQQDLFYDSLTEFRKARDEIENKTMQSQNRALQTIL